MRKIMMAAALALGTTTVAAPLSAQIVGGGLVVVNISNLDVANNIARDANVSVQDVLDIGNVGVQVPIGIAANVCPNVNAAVLAGQRNAGQDTTCSATNTTRAFSNLVARQIAKTKQQH